MKKLILSLTLMAFAIAVQADDAKPAKTQAKQQGAQQASGCCAEKNVQTKATCSEAKKVAASGCCKETPVKQALLSPKDAAQRGL